MSVIRSRREFFGIAAATVAGAGLFSKRGFSQSAGDRPALLGGTPLHIYGMPCDVDPILAAAGKRRLPVIEDACQAWLAEYKERMCGTIGDLGCLGFQHSRHLPSGEGGAITGNSDGLLDRAGSFHDCGRPYGGFKGARPTFTRGGDFRMQHFQAAMLLQQCDKLVQETARRRENADRLTAWTRSSTRAGPSGSSVLSD